MSEGLTNRQAWARLRELADQAEWLVNDIKEALEAASFDANATEVRAYDDAAADLLTLLRYLGSDQPPFDDVLDQPVQAAPPFPAEALEHLPPVNGGDL